MNEVGWQFLPHRVIEKPQTTTESQYSAQQYICPDTMAAVNGTSFPCSLRHSGLTSCFYFPHVLIVDGVDADLPHSLNWVCQPQLDRYSMLPCYSYPQAPGWDAQASRIQNNPVFLVPSYCSGVWSYHSSGLATELCKRLEPCRPLWTGRGVIFYKPLKQSGLIWLDVPSPGEAFYFIDKRQTIPSLLFSPF